nr:hypothetical protein [Tanacetum cinerariifolium]
MSGAIPPIIPPFVASSGNPSSPYGNRVDTMPTTTYPISTTRSHVTNVPAFDKEDFTSWKVKKIDKGKSEKGLIAGSFNWDEESVSSEDEGTTRIRAFIAIAEDEPSVGKADARSGQWFNITMKKGKSEKGKIDKGKSEKGLIAGSFNWDEESVSLEDEGTTRIRAFIAIAEDEPSVIDMLKSGQRQSKTDKIGHENRMSAKKDAAEGKFILSPNQI